MPLPAVRMAIRRAGLSRPHAPEHVHQLACWLGTSFAGTARHLVNLRLLAPEQASGMVRTWRTRNQKIRAALIASAIPPQGRVWMIRAEASHASLHVLPGDTLAYAGVTLPDPLPRGLAVHPQTQLSYGNDTFVVVTDALRAATELSARSRAGQAGIVVTLIPPPPHRSGHTSAWQQSGEAPAGEEEM